MPRTTIVKDSHGCVHIWKGFKTVTYHPTLPKAEGIEADLFVQSCSAVDTIMEYLTDTQVKSLENGYAVFCTRLPPEYFTT